MTTLVSAFIANANQRSDRSVDDYIAYGKKILESNINKIIFMDEDIIEKLPDLSHTNNTVIIPIKKSDNYLYAYKDQITNFQLNSTHPEKDTLEYMITICGKTEHVRKAIELDPFQSSQFIWVDFGIIHMFKNDVIKLRNALSNIQNNSYDNVRIGSIWNPELYDVMRLNFNTNIYKDITWYFAGSVFGGNPYALVKFADLMQKQCIKIIEEKQTLMWEVNIWYQVFSENKDLFSLYNCDHNSTILENY
jgi:hypothetical protein